MAGFYRSIRQLLLFVLVLVLQQFINALVDVVLNLECVLFWAKILLAVNQRQLQKAKKLIPAAGVLPSEVQHDVGEDDAKKDSKQENNLEENDEASTRESPKPRMGDGDYNMTGLPKSHPKREGAECLSPISPFVHGSTPPASSEITQQQWRLLGQGGFGKVFAIGNKAVKFIRCRELADQDAAYFEFHCMAKGGSVNRNILAAHSFAIGEDNTARIEMELCKGSVWDWCKMLSAMKLNIREREIVGLNFLWHVAGALDTLQGAGIAHLDIKLSNILMTDFPSDPFGIFPEGLFKVADFGLALDVEGGKKLEGMRGTKWHVAPELKFYNPSSSHDGPLPGTKCDLFSLGVAFWHLISGRIINAADPIGAWPCLWEVTKQTRKILFDLLEENPDNRLSAKEVLSHPCLLQHPLLDEQGRGVRENLEPQFQRRRASGGSVGVGVAQAVVHRSCHC